MQTLLQKPNRYISSCRPTTRSRQPVAIRASKRPEYFPGRISDPDYVRIFDTTLRDGEQSPGCTLTSKEKLDIARQLSKLGVDIIEAGFPVASPDDFEAVRQIAQIVGNDVDADGYVPVICGLSRTKPQDLERAWVAVKDAKLPRVHTFIATSEIHMKHKLRMSRAQVVENAVTAVQLLKSLGCNDIEFSPEDAGRSDPEFLYEILAEVIKAGATTLNIPDTTGWNLPHEFGGLIASIKSNTPGIENVIISTHCQNDLGLSTANSLAGAMNGARQIECTINGIGERAGNASLEEVVMALSLRGKSQMSGLWSGVNPVHIYPSSRMVADYSGMLVQPHKAIVGANAFAHESGIHQDGMLKSRETYEIMTPESIGLYRAATDAGIVLGKHSGRNALKTRISESISIIYFCRVPTELDDVFKRFKMLADKKKNIEDDDVMALLSDELHQPEAIWSLIDLQVVCGTMGMPTATIKLRGQDGVEVVGVGVGTGPVDAAYKAVDSVMKTEGTLLDYSTGAHEDVVVSSVRAYINALNKLLGTNKTITSSTGDSMASVENVEVKV
eukprot:gene16399-22603_t